MTAKDSNGETLLSETLYYAPSMNVQKNYLVDWPYWLSLLPSRLWKLLLTAPRAEA